MARNTRKTPNPNGPKLSKSKRKGNKKTMKKQKGGGLDEENLQIDLYTEDGLRKTPTPVNSHRELIDIINANMSNFNGRILGCENRLGLN
jgi:hypothetical protein